MIKDSIDIWRIGLLAYKYRTFGEIYRPREYKGFITYPIPDNGTTIGEGYALTKWGANRKAKRSLKYNR
jgi:hypothetical protein